MQKAFNLRLAVMAAVSALIFTISTTTASYADLLITPVRVVLEGKDRSAVVTLVNTSDKVRTYRMGWKKMRMSELGQYSDIEGAAADDFEMRAQRMTEMIKFSPRQVTIEPGGRQRIRLSLRRPETLAEGEYRAHMQFERLPEPRELDANNRGVKFDLQINLGFTIPVIFKNGSYEADAKIAEKIEYVPAEPGAKNGPLIRMTLERSGAGSVYGRVLVKSSGGAKKELGVLNNVAIFQEMGKRIIEVPLDVKNPDVHSIRPGSQLRVSFEGDGEFRGRTWDEKVLTLQ